MEVSDRKLRHDIRGHFQNLLLSIEVQRCELTRADRLMFLGQLINACEAIDTMLEQIPENLEPVAT